MEGRAVAARGCGIQAGMPQRPTRRSLRRVHRKGCDEARRAGCACTNLISRVPIQSPLSSARDAAAASAMMLYKPHAGPVLRIADNFHG